jgi:hypothetical protein
MSEEKRRFGPYTVEERTARRLAVERTGKPLQTVGLLWAVWVPIALLIGPWRGGAALAIALSASLVAAIISLLILRFVPRRTWFAVDLESGEFRSERSYLLLRAPKATQAGLDAVAGIRCRRQLWRDMPGVEATRWVVELVAQDGRVWRLAKEEQEAPMNELARLVAEVSGRPLLTEE